MLSFLMLITAGMLIYGIWLDADEPNRRRKAEHELRYKTDPNYRKFYDMELAKTKLKRRKV